MPRLLRGAFQNRLMIRICVESLTLAVWGQLVRLSSNALRCLSCKSI